MTSFVSIPLRQLFTQDNRQQLKRLHYSTSTVKDTSQLQQIAKKQKLCVANITTHLSFSSLESMNNYYNVKRENDSSKIDKYTPYLKVPFRIPVKYVVTEVHKIEPPKQIYYLIHLIFSAIPDVLCKIYLIFVIPKYMRVKNCLETDWVWTLLRLNHFSHLGWDSVWVPFRKFVLLLFSCCATPLYFHLFLFLSQVFTSSPLEQQ